MIGIEQLAQRIERLATPAPMAAVSRSMATTAIALFQTGFAARTNPYSNRWAQRVKSVPWPILERTGYLRASGELEAVSAEGFRLHVYAPYAWFHQHGTARMVSRKVVPDAVAGLGAWQRPLELAARNTFLGYLN